MKILLNSCQNRNAATSFIFLHLYGQDPNSNRLFIRIDLPNHSEILENFGKLMNTLRYFRQNYTNLHSNESSALPIMRSVAAF